MKRWALLLFLFALPAFGQGAFYQLPTPLPNATLYVCPVQAPTNPCGSPASIFSNSNLTGPITQPVHLGSDGNFGFWVTPGQYALQVQAPYNIVTTISLGGGSASFGQLTGGSNTSTLTMGSGGSLSQLNIGQVAGSQMWLAAGLSSPTVTNTTGGTWLNGHAVQIAYTLVSAAGQTLISVINSNSVQNFGACSNNCVLILTAPTIPSGYTGYTAYMCDTTSGPCAAPVQIPSCINITGNCSVSAPVTSGTATPTINAAWIQPPNIQAFNGFNGGLPSVFFPKADGNYYPWISMDWADCDNTNGPLCPAGTPLFTHRTYFSDLGGSSVAYPNQQMAFKNAFIAINHGAGIGTATTNQDRALGILMQNPAADSATHYGMEGIQAETDYNGTSVINGSPDGEVAAGSFQVADSHTGTPISPPGGEQAVRAQTFIESGAGSFVSCSGNPCISAVRAYMTDLSSSGGSSDGIAALYARTWNANGSHTTRQGYGAYIQSPGSSFRLGTANIGLYVEPWLVSTNVNDKSFWFDGASSTASKGVIQPALYLGGGMVANQCALCTNLINNSGTTSIPVSGSFQLSGGSISTAQLGNLVGVTNFACSVTGSTGTSYSYGIAGIDGNGNATQVAGNVCIVSAAATLNGSNFVTLTISGAQYGKGYARFDVYRTASAGVPATTGFIGSMSCIGTTDIESAIGSVTTFCTFNDTGLSASGSVPTANTTGGIVGYNFGTLTNCAAVGSAASPSVAACASASAGSFSCATNATGATCTVNTTAVTANSQIFVQEDETLGSRLGVTCNTSTNVLPTSRLLSARVAATSFTINLGTVTTNPACFSYFLVN